MINWKKSAEINKMKIDVLKEWFIKYPSSAKKIIRICNNCKQEREISFYNYRDLCYNCSTTDLTYCKERSISATKYWSDPIHCKEQSIKITEYWKNHPEYRKEQSIKHTNRFKDQDILNEQTIKWKNYWSSQDHRNEQSIRLIEYYKDIMNREKHSAAHLHIPYEEWEKFAEDKAYCPLFNNKCRESNREKYSRRCFLCNKLESENIVSNGKQQRLSVHHYNMNKWQGCDGIKWKLVPLCVHCHGIVHNELWEYRINWLLRNIWSKIND